MFGEAGKIKIYNQRSVGKRDEGVVAMQDKNNYKHVFIVGSKGIPACYGGFESFVEMLTRYRKADKICYHVARMSDENGEYEYNKARCFDVKVPEIRAAKAVYYDLAALRYCITYCKKNPDIKEPVFYVLACRIGPFMNYFKRQIERIGGKLLINPDGHEWKRSKWNVFIRKYWKISEKLMVKHADLLVCDSKSIQQYIREDYRKYQPNTTYISYGAEVGVSQVDENIFQEWMRKRQLSSKGYYLVVGRLVPENNYETMLKEFMQSETDRSLVLITNLNEEFLEKLKKTSGFEKDERIQFSDAIYDGELLKKVRENAYAYIHGHEVGGTNPSLLEAMGSTKLNLLFDVGFNREVAEESAVYWSKEEGNLSSMIARVEKYSEEEIEAFAEKARRRISDAYNWTDIVDQYETLFLRSAHLLDWKKSGSAIYTIGHIELTDVRRFF